MHEIIQFTGFLDVIVLPILAGFALVMSKISDPEAARQWERHFMVTLVVVTIVTLRTVIYCDDAWLVHMMTLGSLIIAALIVPNQNANVAVQ